MASDSAHVFNREKNSAAASTTQPPLADLSLLILFPFAALCLCVVVATLLRDGDTGWHLGAGAWMLEHHAVPGTDPFSFSAHGKPWVAHEWLSELAMITAWRIAGWSGVMALFGVALAALYAIVTQHLVRWQRAGAAAVMLIYMSIGSYQSWLARPHLLALPLLAYWLVSLMRAREADRAPPAALALLMLIWVNAHGSFVLGLALTGAFGLEALVMASAARRLRVVIDWGRFGLLCLIVALLNPAGIHGLLYPFYVNNLTLIAHIGEWQPANFGKWTGFEILILSALFFLFFRPTRIPVIRLLILLGTFHLALQHLRQEIILAVMGTLLLAEPLGRAWADGEQRPRPPLLPRLWRERHDLAPLLLVGAALYVGMIGFRLAVPFARPDSSTVPLAALQHVPADLRRQPVFNEYSFGGLLIYKGIRPFIDGRSDMYGDAFTEDYVKIADGDTARWRAAERKWRFGWVIMPPDSPLVALVAREPGWRQIYADKNAAILAADRARPGSGGRHAQAVGQVHAP